MPRIRDSRTRACSGSQARHHARSASLLVAPLGRNTLSVMTIHSPAYTDPTTGSGDS